MGPCFATMGSSGFRVRGPYEGTLKTVGMVSSSPDVAGAPK